MVSIILITSLVIIILIILLSFVSKMTRSQERLKTQSIVIIDTRGQQAVSEVEFVRFMDKMGAILVNSRHFEQPLDINQLTKRNGKSYRDKFQTKYLDPAAEELKMWIKETDNNPFCANASFTNPLDDELNSLAGENNPILINKKQKNIGKIEERLTSLEDLANYIQQIKDINLQFPDNERKAVNLVHTHKLIVELLRQYYDSVDPKIFDKPITKIDLPTGKHTPIGEAKMKQHKQEKDSMLDSSLSQRNSLVESTAFADDDKLGTSNARTRANPLDADTANAAIEGMVIRRQAPRINYTGGRKHIH